MFLITLQGAVHATFQHHLIHVRKVETSPPLSSLKATRSLRNNLQSRILRSVLRARLAEPDIYFCWCDKDKAHPLTVGLETLGGLGLDLYLLVRVVH